MAVKKSGCKKFMRLGDSACRKCSNRTCEHPEPEDDESEEEEEEEEEEEPEEESEEDESEGEPDGCLFLDEYGNEGSSLWWVPISFTVLGHEFLADVKIAAESAEDAKDIVRNQLVISDVLGEDVESFDEIEEVMSIDNGDRIRSVRLALDKDSFDDPDTNDDEDVCKA